MNLVFYCVINQGLLAFYSGLTPSLIGVFPYAATSYFVYDALCSTYRRTMKMQSVPMIPTLTFGAISAATSSAVTYPLEERFLSLPFKKF